MFELVSLLPSIIGFILATILLVRFPKMSDKRFLAYTCMSLSICLLTMRSYAFPERPFAWFWDLMTVLMTFLTPAFLYIYQCKLTKVDGVSKNDWRILFFPSVMVSVNLICYIVMVAQGHSTTEYLTHVNEIKGVLPEDPFVFKVKRLFGSDLYRMVTLVMTLGVLFYSFTASKQYLRTLDEYFSSIHEESHRNHWTMMTCFFCALTGAIIFMTRTFSTDISYLVWASIGGALMVGSMITMFIFSLGKHHTMSRLQELIREAEIREEENKKKEIVDPQELIRQKIDEAIANKFYLDPDVNLIQLTTEIGSNRTYVSSYINSEYGCSFSDFVNSKRVEDAKILIEKISGNPDYDEIMKMAGFNSRQSFIRNFSKFAGYTPAEYYKITH